MPLPFADTPDIILTVPGVIVPRRQVYIRKIIQEGHRPGVLSGADLPASGRGRDGAPRVRSRRRAVALVAALLDGVAPRKVRGCLVWTDAAGCRVRIRITD